MSPYIPHHLVRFFIVMKILTTKQIASVLLIGVRRVQQLTKDGIIPKVSRGRYDLIPAVQGYIHYLQSMVYAECRVNLNRISPSD